MIREDGIEFKNPRIEEIINYSNENQSVLFGEDQRKAGAFIRSLSKQQLAENVVGGFWYSFFECMMNDVRPEMWFDFTYDTLDRLPATVIALYNRQRNAYSDEQNRLIIGKTLAAVLIGLAMNEHGCEWSVGKLKDRSQVGSQLDWAADTGIRIGTKEPTDFRTAGLSVVVQPPMEVENGAYISVAPLVNAYKTAMGVDLARYGLNMDIIISGRG